MTRIALVALVALVTQVFGSSAAEACKREQSSLATAFNLADAVFVGRVIAVRKTPVDAARCAKRPAWCLYNHTAEVEVELDWKGDPPARTEVFTGNGAGDCSFGAVRPGQRWLFMAKLTSPAGKARTTAPFSIHHATGTVRATEASIARVTARFGAPTAPR